MTRVFPHREDKLNLARRMLRDRASAYAINKECKRLYKSGLGYNDILALQAEMEHQRDLITPIAVPAEVLEAETPEEDLSATGLTVPSPVPNGTTVHLKAIQTWMAKVQAEQITLTRDGKLSVLAWHQFDLGGPND